MPDSSVRTVRLTASERGAASAALLYARLQAQEHDRELPTPNNEWIREARRLEVLIDGTPLRDGHIEISAQAESSAAFRAAAVMCQHFGRGVITELAPTLRVLADRCAGIFDGQSGSSKK